MIVRIKQIQSQHVFVVVVYCYYIINVLSSAGIGSINFLSSSSSESCNHETAIRTTAVSSSTTSTSSFTVVPFVVVDAWVLSSSYSTQRKNGPMNGGDTAICYPRQQKQQQKQYSSKYSVIYQNGIIGQSSVVVTKLWSRRNQQHDDDLTKVQHDNKNNNKPSNEILIIRNHVEKRTTTAATRIMKTDDTTNNNNRNSRRSFFMVCSGILSSSSFFVGKNDPNIVHAAVQRAVGSYEQKCRKEQNCLEIGDLDGAVGWDWGSKNRCDATDPLCGPDGQYRTSPLVGQPVPSLPQIKAVSLENTNEDSTPIPVTISHVVILTIAVGRDEIGLLKIGLYGNDCPGSVTQLLDFLSDTGFDTLSDVKSLSSFVGTVSSPVSLLQGGVIHNIVPNEYIEMGVPNQGYAYARARGVSKAGDNFIPQPSPPISTVEKDVFIRYHDCAGLLSVPSKGIGYNTNKNLGYVPDDELYEGAMLFTAAPIQSSLLFDNNQQQKQKNTVTSGLGSRRVIGQILDATSMAFLERLANLPTKRGIKGVLPGQTFGPPLLKTMIKNVQIAKVTPQPGSK